MLAVHLESGRVEMRSQPLPRIAQGFARIRLLAAGICSTDLELQRGYYGFSGTPGHEFVGEVTEAEDQQWVGKRVVGEINLACGACDWCARRLGRHCPRRTVLGIVKHPGAFREFLTLPVGNLHRVPASISTEQAVFIEPVAAACEILDQVRIPKGQKIAVLGDGKLGLLVSQVLQAHGARVHLYGHHRDKMRLVEAAGVTAELIGKNLPKRVWPMVVDATGSAEGLRASVALCEPRGTVISDEFPLDRAPEAFARASSKGVLKVLLRTA
jgi:alcohol dehydrogenase